jgi:hypothetical protein
MFGRWNAWGALALYFLVGAPTARAELITGFNTLLSLPPSDNGSSGPVPIGFQVDFYGKLHNSLFVNTNGNITFGAPLASNTPFNLTTTNQQIIAPFFADVDTRAGGQVQYGTGKVDGHNAFEIVWSSVGYNSQHADKTNTFQVRLVDRSDTGAGNFDIQFQYKSLKWDTADLGGAARVGFSAGTGVAGTYFEMPGSGISGAFLDGSANALTHQTTTGVPGKLVFEVRQICHMPEPGCLALAAIGAGGLLAYRWKRQRGRVG